MSIYIGDKEIKDFRIGDSGAKEVYVGNNKVRPSIINFATQGPAPNGFHVPLQSEWIAVYNILITTFGLSDSATTTGTYLKMPTAGWRSCEDANVYDVGDVGYYWSSVPEESWTAYTFSFDQDGIYTEGEGAGFRALGLSARCFKDAPTIPTSSWTTLYQGGGSAGVFWNSTDGLISISGDGSTRYTIMDKNLGATTVFNQGDTVNDANSGYFYQWGNNYGFPHSGTVTTSLTQVDASSYGPGNYYSSSTFITTSGEDWSSVQNDNLRGGVDGNVPV